MRYSLRENGELQFSNKKGVNQPVFELLTLEAES